MVSELQVLGARSCHVAIYVIAHPHLPFFMHIAQVHHFVYPVQKIYIHFVSLSVGWVACKDRNFVQLATKRKPFGNVTEKIQKLSQNANRNVKEFGWVKMSWFDISSRYPNNSVFQFVSYISIRVARNN